MKRSEIGHKSQLASVSVSDGPINSTYRLFNHASAKSLFNLKMHMVNVPGWESSFYVADTITLRNVNKVSIVF